MKTTRKYYKDHDFAKNSNIAFELRVDSEAKVKDWTKEQKAEAINFLNRCVTDIGLQLQKFHK